MFEQHNIEYKSSWHDDYLKWICGFANAQGGRIYIGRDDSGEAVGLDNCKKLRGRYYYRSGSVKQELTGSALNEFLLKRAGRTWDDVVENRASFDDIDERTVGIFLRMAENAGRLPDINGVSTPELLEKLRLAENGQLKRAAIVLFGKDPGRFYPNTFVKIGKFADNDFEILFQETEEGNIIQVLDSVLRQLNHKFLIRKISFEGMNRIETLEYPVVALREMLLNALIHRNYMGAPTQIRVYDNKLSVWNHGTLPEGITLDKLAQSHSSYPRNPIIAEACFRGGFIDAWGSGIMKIFNSCKMAQMPAPSIEEDGGGFMVKLFKDKFSEEELHKTGLNARQIVAVQYVKEKGKITNGEYQKLNNCSRNTASIELNVLVNKSVLENSDMKGAGSFYKLNIIAQ